MKQTTLCYIDDGTRYLMLHRVKKENDASHGKWIGEVKEETGLEITHWHYRGIVTFISDTWPNEYMHLFTASEWQGNIDMDCNEGDLAWIAKDKLMDLRLWEGDRIFLRLLLDESTPFFSLKLIYVQDEMTTAILNGNLLT